MSVVAVLGAGPLGAAIAQRLAERARVREIRLIDSSAGIAAGKALDLLQSGPIGGYDTRLSGMTDPLAAAGADAVVLADDTATGEWEGERGLGLVRQLTRAGAPAPIVFAGPRQIWLMEAAARELKLHPDRLVGTAASAVVSAVSSLAAIELDRSGVDVGVYGRPPALVIGWSGATIAGTAVTDLIPAHRLLAISNAVPRLWPPGPQAIAASTALVVEALILGSRRLRYAMTVLDERAGARGVAAMLPLDLGGGRVRSRIRPKMSPQETTDFLNSLAAKG